MRIRTHLLLLLLSTILVSSLSIFLQIRSASRGLLQTYVFRGDREKANLYASILGEYYRGSSSWGEVQAFLMDLPRLVSAGLEKRFQGANPTRFESFTTEAIRSLLLERVVLADEQGIIIADSTGLLLGSKHPERHLQGGVPVVVEGRTVGIVLVGSMIDSSLTDSAETFLSSMNRSLLTSILVSGILALVLGGVFAIRITRPLEALALGARRVGSGNLTVRIQPKGHREARDLAVSFNEMARELEEMERSKRRLIADVAHELRTPLTLIRGTLEGMRDGIIPSGEETLDSVLEETRRLSRLIDTLRELELMESGNLRLRLERIEPEELVSRVVGSFRMEAEEKNIHLTTEIEGLGLPPIEGDILRLEQVLYNLLMNALRYTPEGGSVRVRAGTRPESGAIVLSVEDSGPGIPVEERQKVFERFYRLDKSRSPRGGGRGLGLAIAREIVRAHGGTIRVTQSQWGGAAFQISLPLQRS
ncbi:MAG: ATP-binding protein [Spirochaetales bacterium]